MLEFYVYIYLDSRKPGKYRYAKYEFKYEPFYVGKGHDNGRIKKHLSEAYNKKDTNSFKCRKIRKIKKETGKDPIYFKIEERLTEKQAFELEARLIQIIGKAPNGPLTNMTDGGEGVSNPAKSVRMKIGNTHRGRKLSENHKKKLSKAHEGQKHSEETKRKISRINKGKKRTKIQRENLSKGQIGRKLSKETKRKISKTQKGRVFSEETKRKMSKGQKGRKLSEEAKRKISKTLKNRIFSEKTKEKMRKARLGRKFPRNNDSEKEI